MTEVLGACPLDCPDGCSWVVTVEDGEAVRLRGNREHPFTAGALCAKVNGYLEHTRAPDRLLYPLRRVGAQGRGTLRADLVGRRRSEEIAARLHAVSDEHGGEAIWPFQGTGSLGYIQGLEGRAGQRAVERARRLAPRHDDLLGRRPHRRHLHDRDRGRDGPGDVRAVEADPAVGHEHAHQRPPPVEVRAGGAQARRARGGDRPAAHAHGRARRRAPGAAPRHRRRARARAAARGRRHGRAGRRVPRRATPSAGRRSASASSSTRPTASRR